MEKTAKSLRDIRTRTLRERRPGIGEQLFSNNARPTYAIAHHLQTGGGTNREQPAQPYAR